MDLGCLDMGCIAVSDKKLNSESSLDTESKASDAGSEPVTATSKIGKNKNSKENTQTTLNSIIKSASQIKKPSHRKNSPVNWFPRKKVDSFLKRKIKMLQEVAGMNLTLDETLDDSNPHYSKVLKEKMAAREAANKAIEARKVALVEASWCRILKAARIQRKEAEEELVKAEAVAAEAFEAALAIGVNMYDIPNCPQKPHRGELSLSSSSYHSREGLATHGVMASFETAFEVDKEVASSVKTALIKLANGSSFNKDEFRDLLRKISENPDTYVNGEERSEDSSPKRELKLSGSEIETTVIESGSKMGSQSRMRRTRRSGNKRRKSLEKLNATVRLVDKMFERLEGLKEEELSSLTTIVATCGLSAALAVIEGNKLNDTDQTSRRMSSRESTGKVENLVGRHVRKHQTEPELPSLDKCLVKHVTRLEREVQEAKNTRKESKEERLEGSFKNIAEDTETALVDEAKKSLAGDFRTGCAVPDLGSVLVNKHSSKLEKEIEEAKKNFNRETQAANRMVDEAKKSSEGDCKAGSKIPDLGSVLVNKHSSKLEKEIEEAKKNFNRETQAANRMVRHVKEDTSELPGLDKVLVKRMTRLEKEVQEAKDRRQNEALGVRTANLMGKENKGDPNTKQSGDSLESVLVKPVHRFEREKTRTECESLEKVLMVKPKSRLERGGNTVAWQEEKEEAKEDRVKVSAVARREARERELQEAWGGFGLGNSVKPHLSRLERDKAAWIKADEEEKQSMASSNS